MALKLLQWNCRSIRPKVSELHYLINKYKPTVCAFSETWLKPDSNFLLSGFACFRDDRSDGRAGCALYIKDYIPYVKINIPPHSTDFHVVAVRALNICFISVYIPHPNFNIISQLNSMLSSFTGPFIVMGDFNCRHPLWGSNSSDAASSLLLNLLDDINLCVLNDGSPTRRVSPFDNVSVPDLSFASTSLVNSLSWSVLTNSHGSDHFPIIINLNQSSSPSPVPQPLLKYKLHNVDWNKFSSVLNLKLSHMSPELTPNSLSVYFEFTSCLLAAADDSIPLKGVHRDWLPSPPWWDGECTAMVKQRKEAENKYASNLNMDNFLNYKKTCAQTKRLLSSKKRIGWKRFCENLSPRTSASLVWKKIKAFRKSQSVFSPSSNDTSPWLEDFINKLAPPFVPYLDNFPNSNLPPSTDRMNEPFSFSELICALDNLHDSSPGIDGIPYSFITNSSNLSKKIFLNIINYIFSTGDVPETWKTQIIIPILKPGKDPLDSSSYRPIALSSVLAKIMEHLIKNRLEWILENRGLLSKSQFGFRRGMGTIDSLSIFTSDVRLAFSKNNHVIGVFLDIASAYDNVQLPVLREKMIQLSIPDRMVNINCMLFMGRSISVRIRGTLLPPRHVWKGLPQGSVLSPLLYNLYTSDLNKSVDCFSNILQYADDIALYVSSSSFEVAASRINSALFYLNQWLDDHGLSLSVPKSQAVIFSRKRNVPNVTISINNENISIIKKVKFLGIILDSKLSGMEHLNYIVNKCERNINILRALSGVWWGSHPYSQKLLYNAIIRSHFDYGTFLLEPCNKIALGFLDKVQSKCLRIILGAMKSSPVNALQVECFEPPLHLRRQYLADRFFFKTLKFSSHPILKITKSLSRQVNLSEFWTHKEPPPLVISYRKYLNLNSPVAQFTKNFMFNINFDALIFQPHIILNFGIEKHSAGADNHLNRILDKDWSDWLVFYTDASKISENSSVGAAVWCPKFKIILNFKCPSLCSVFTGEAVALMEAISFVESHRISKSLILSDSLSCLQDIKKPPFHSKHNFFISLKVKELLYNCHSLGLEVVLAWIPGHSGIRGNETADLCAKEAIERGIPYENAFSSRDLCSLARPRMLDSWNNLWQKSRQIKGKYYGNIQPLIPPRPWFFKYRCFDKLTTSVIIRLRLGHVCTPVFLAKIKVRDHSLCECGLDDGTLEHIFFSCPKITVSIFDLLPADCPRPINIPFLLTLVHSPMIKVLGKFISINNIKL